MFFNNLMKIGMKNVIKASAIMGILCSINPLLSDVGSTKSPISIQDTSFNYNSSFKDLSYDSGTFNKKIKTNKVKTQKNNLLSQVLAHIDNVNMNLKSTINEDNNSIKIRIKEKKKDMQSTDFSNALFLDMLNSKKTNKINQISTFLSGIGADDAFESTYSDDVLPKSINFNDNNSKFVNLLKDKFHFYKINDENFFSNRDSTNKLNFLQKYSLNDNKEAIDLFNAEIEQRKLAYLSIPGLVAELIKIQALIIQNGSDNKADMANIDIISNLINKSVTLSNKLKNKKTVNDIKRSFYDVKKYYEENIGTLQNLTDKQINRILTHSAWIEDLNEGKELLGLNLTKEEEQIAYLPPVEADIIAINYYLKQMNNYINHTSK